MEERLDASWKTALMAELAAPYFIALKTRLSSAYASETVFPPEVDIFKAFTLCPFTNVKVVILGQDPYHGPGQAHGLAFSVQDGVKPPPSLQNIFKEVRSDIGSPEKNSGNLEPWATQGVLLLNTTLTVAAGTPGSHANWGWTHFTDAVIKALSTEREQIVFLLWGKHAEAKESLIDTKKHHVLKAPHPSPLSAHRGFLGCRHFSQTNHYLQSHGIQPIVW